ncbi:MAG: response regulator [Arenicella sp.]|nr:response regulator [Arenicella sp.]
MTITTEQMLDFCPTEARKLEVMFSHVFFTGNFSVLIMAVCALLMRNTENFNDMLIWVSINAVFVMMRWFCVFKPFSKLTNPSEEDYRRNYWFLMAAWFISGSIWGVGAYSFLPAGNEPELFITFITIYVGVTTGNMPNFSSSVLAGILFIYPAILGLSVKVYEYGYYYFFFVTLVYLIYTTIVLVRLTRIIGKSISLDVQNGELLKQVTVEKENAESASQDKSRFLAAASHDLRQPLNSLGLFLFSLRKRFTKADTAKVEFLDGADNAFKSLSELLTSLLEISRFDDGSINVNHQPVRIADVSKPVIAEFESICGSKGLLLSDNLTNTTVTTDPVLFVRMLRNLIDNAIKYTHHGSVTINESLENGQLTISVVDTGIGIESKELIQIFDEYHQIANKRRNRREGIGLGLSIVKKMSQLLEHPVKVTSEIGVGSSFSITLPVSSIEPAELIKADEERASLYGLQVLVIDDESEVLIAMRGALESLGCEASCAETLEQAVEQYKLAKPDIILSDFRLHQTSNGVQVIEKLRQQFGSNVPAIIISGDRSTELKDELKNTGLGLLAKPISPDKLHKMILSMLE